MAQTKVRQDRLHVSNSYSDTETTGAGMELTPGDAVGVDSDLNNIRTMLRVFSGSSDWYLDPASNTNVFQTTSDNARQVFAFRTQVLTDVTVPAAQNWVVLSVAGSEAPTVTASVGAVTTEGAVVASIAGSFNSNQLTAVTGSNAISPVNLCLVVDAATSDPITSGGFEVFALLQSEVATDGHTFNDTTQQVQLSFVRRNAGGTALEAVPVVDIANAVINYSYVRRLQYQNLPESAFLSGLFSDQISATDVTLDAAIDNQAGFATQGQDIQVRIDDTFSWSFRDSAGLSLFSVDPAVAGDQVTIAGDETQIDSTTFDVNSTTVDFAQGIAVDTADTTLNLGVTAAGQIDTAANLNLTSTAGSATLNATGANTTIQTTTSGDVDVISAGAVDVNATTTVTVDTANAADASGNDITVTAGSSTAGNADGASIIFTPGAGFGSGARGVVTSTHAGPDSDAVMSLSTTGTGGDQMELYTGNSDPTGRFAANIGSLFMDGTNGTMYINTDGLASGWSQFQAGGGGDTLQTAYVSGNTITTSLAEGDVSILGTETLIVSTTGGLDLNTVFDFDGTSFDVQMTGTNGFSIDGTAASNMTVDAGTLDIATTTSGAVRVDGVGGVEINAPAAQSILIGNDAVAADVEIATGAASRTVTVGNATGATAVDFDSGTGAFSFDSTVAETVALMDLTTTGTNGDSVSLFVGSSDPNGAVTANAGSLFMRDTGTGGELYINTSSGSGTTWQQVQSGAAAANDWATVLAAGNISGGTDPVMTSGDTFRGVDGATPSALVMRGGDSNAAATAGGAASLTGGTTGTGAGAGAGGAVTISGGTPGNGTGTGGLVTVQGGAGGTDTGNAAGGGVSILGGSADTGGAGGAVLVQAGDNLGATNGLADQVTVLGGTATGAANAGGGILVKGGEAQGTSANANGGDLVLGGGDVAGGNANIITGAVTIESGSGTTAPYTTGDITVQVPQVVNTLNVGGGDVTVQAGNTGIRNAPGGTLTLNAGDSNGGGGALNTGGNVLITAGDQTSATGGGGGSITLTTGSSAALEAGEVTLTGPNNENEALVILTTTGTNGDSVQLFVGDSDPSGSVTGLAGSMFFRDTGTSGAVYINTSNGSGTTWAEITTTATSGVDLQTAYDNGNTIVTSGGSGPLDVSGTEVISLDATGASNFTATTGSLTLSTATSGSVLIDGVDGVEINSSGGNLFIGNDANTGAIGIGGGAAARTITVGNTTGATAVDFDSGTGAFSFDSTTADTSALMDLTTTGTGGDAVGLFVGSSSPDTRVTAAIGSIFLDGTNAGLWMNTDGVTAWAQFQTGAASQLSDVVTDVGTSPSTQSATFDWRIADGDVLNWNTTGPENLLNLQPAGGGDTVTIGHGTGDTFAVDTATNSFATGISVDDAAAGTEIRIGLDGGGGAANEIAATGGALTVSADGGALTLNSDSEGDNVAIATAANTTGAGGDITATAGASTGGNGAGGDVVATAGAGNGTGAGGAVTGTAGAGGATGAGGAVTMTAGAGGTTSGAGGALALNAGDANGSGVGGAATVTSGDGANSNSGGDISLTVGTSNGAAGGDINLSAGVGNGSANAGGNVLVTPGASGGAGIADAGFVRMDFTDGSTTGEGGFLHLDSDAEPATAQIMRLDSADAASNGGTVDFFVGNIAAGPNTNVTANQNGDMFFNENGDLWVKATGGATNTGWEQITTTGSSVSRGKTVAATTGAITANTNVTGVGGGANLDATLGDYSGVTFVDDVDVYVNGVLQRNGANSGANFDVYPGTTATNGDLAFEYALSSGDVLTMIIWG